MSRTLLNILIAFEVEIVVDQNFHRLLATTIFVEEGVLLKEVKSPTPSKTLSYISKTQKQRKMNIKHFFMVMALNLDGDIDMAFLEDDFQKLLIYRSG